MYIKPKEIKLNLEIVKRNSLTPKLDAIALDLCIRLEEEGILAVPIPTNESEWDADTNRWRSIVSQN